jgi:hypothetical protein
MASEPCKGTSFSIGFGSLTRQLRLQNSLARLTSTCANDAPNDAPREAPKEAPKGASAKKSFCFGTSDSS